MQGMGRTIAAVTLGVVLAVPALASDEEPERVMPASLEGSSIAWCGDVDEVQPDPALFRDTPVYIANEQPTRKVQKWARKQPGFADLWIDRDHLGWLVVAFSQDADLRQAEIEELFPDDGVVAVEVEHTTRELRKLQQRLSERFRRVPHWSGVDVTSNVVEFGVAYVTPELVRQLEAEFGGQPFCLDGRDPSERPVAGPQPTEGDGWTLIGYEHDSGPNYRTGAATDAGQLARLWRRSGVDGAVPDVDFDETIVVWFAIGHGSTCDELRMDDVVVDVEAATIYPRMVDLEDNVGCTDDLAGAFQYLVAVDRDRLPPPPFVVQTGPPQEDAYGASMDQTVVEANLREPGAVAAADQIQPARRGNEEPVMRSGAFVEPFGSWSYLLDATCGIGYLGEINDIHWVSEETDVPAAWAPALGPDGELLVEIAVRARPEPHVDATLGGQTVCYLPAAEAPASCEA